MKNSKQFFTPDQCRVIQKLKFQFSAELAEVQNEAWLLLIDLKNKDRDSSEFERVLFSRLKSIHGSRKYLPAGYLDESWSADDDQGRGFKINNEILIASLPTNSLAAHSIESFSGCKDVLEIARKNNWTRQIARQYVGQALADAVAGYPNDLFAPQRDPNWRPAREFKTPAPTLSDAGNDCQQFYKTIEAV
jgi:hypothetical protein